MIVYMSTNGGASKMRHYIGKDGMMHNTIGGSAKEFWAFIGAAFMAGFLFCYFVYIPCQLTEATATMITTAR